MACAIAPAHGSVSSWPPIINAGPDQYVLIGEPGTLHATAFDYQGDTLTYFWSVGNMVVGPGAMPGFGPDATRHILSFGNLTLSDTTILQPNFTAPDEPHTFTLMLTVSDDSFTCIDTVVVEVVEELPQATPAAGEPEPVPDLTPTCFDFGHPAARCITPEPPLISSYFAPELDPIPNVVMRHDDPDHHLVVSATAYDYPDDEHHLPPPLGSGTAWYDLYSSDASVPLPDFITMDGGQITIAPGPGDVGRYWLYVHAQAVHMPLDWVFRHNENDAVVHHLCYYTYSPLTHSYGDFTVTVLPSASHTVSDPIPDVRLARDDYAAIPVRLGGSNGTVAYRLALAPDFVTMSGLALDVWLDETLKPAGTVGPEPGKVAEAATPGPYMLRPWIIIDPGPGDIWSYAVTVEGVLLSRLAEYPPPRYAITACELAGISLDGGGPGCAGFAIDGTGTTSFRVHVTP